MPSVPLTATSRPNSLATTDLRAVLKGVLGDHLQVPARVLERDVFPDSASVRPLALLRA